MRAFSKVGIKKAEKGESPKNNWTVKRLEPRTEMDTKKAKAQNCNGPKKAKAQFEMLTKKQGPKIVG
jgi:hypothetical protein